jgi:hypothetical protein
MKTNPVPAHMVGTLGPAMGRIDESPSKYSSQIEFSSSVCKIFSSGKLHFSGELS